MKFEVQERVTVPGTAAQGVIVDATETVPCFPIYTLRWLDEGGETHTGTCGEGDLSSCNRTDAELLADARAEKVAEDELDAMVEQRVKARLADIRATRARKAAKKRKR